MTVKPSINTLAKEKLSRIGISDWEPFKYEALPGGTLITGSPTSVIKTGPNKGKKRWVGQKTQVIIIRVDHFAGLKKVH